MLFAPGSGRDVTSWDEILCDILHGKLKIVQNRTKRDNDIEDEDGDDGDEMPEETGERVHENSKHDWRYVQSGQP